MLSTARWIVEHGRIQHWLGTGLKAIEALLAEHPSTSALPRRRPTDDSRSRRRCAPDRSSINPAPDPVFANIENFRPRDRLRARDRSSLDSVLERDGFEPSVPVRQAKLTRSCR